MKKPPAFNPAGKRRTISVLAEAYSACEELRTELEAETGYSLKVGEFFSRMALRGVEATKQERKTKGKNK